MHIQHSEPYAPLRAKAYPDMGDQLDAVLKLAQMLKASGVELPAETVAWIGQCEAVKEKYPKN